MRKFAPICVMKKADALRHSQWQGASVILRASGGGAFIR